MTRCHLIVLSVLAGIVIPASGALAAPPGEATSGPGNIGIRLVGAPAAGDSPLGRSYIVDRLRPGTTLSRRVEIVNTTHATTNVAVYAAGADLHGGTFTFAPGRSQNDLSGWTAVSRGVLRLAPGTGAFETVSIAVPAGASSGERYAVIWAEVSAPAPAGGGVTLVNRVGVRMYVSIGSGGALPSNFAVGSLTAGRLPTGEPFVTATIRNTGRRTLDISGSLTLSGGPGGLRAGPFPVDVGQALAPGASESATVHLNRRIPLGPWQARIVLHSGLVQRATAATITLPPVVVAATPASSHRLELAKILLALLVIVLGFLFFRMHWGRDDLRPPGAIRS